MNRDEADDRAEAGEHLETCANGTLQTWWPIDSVSQGTWFGARGDGLVGALLNRYQGTGTSPRRSRGLIIPWVLANAPTYGLKACVEHNDWRDFAPFDLILVQARKLVRCSWDNGQLKLHEASTEEPYFLSSSSVEYEESLQVRREAFERFLAKKTRDPECIIKDLHRQVYGQNRSLGFLMTRPGRRTKSIAQVVINAAGIQHRYIPLQS